MSIVHQYLYLKPSVIGLIKQIHCHITDMSLQLRSLPGHPPALSSTRSDNLQCKLLLKCFLATQQTKWPEAERDKGAGSDCDCTSQGLMDVHIILGSICLYLALLQPITTPPKPRTSMKQPQGFAFSSLQKTDKNNSYGILNYPVLFPLPGTQTKPLQVYWRTSALSHVQ